MQCSLNFVTYANDLPEIMIVFKYTRLYYYKCYIGARDP